MHAHRSTGEIPTVYTHQNHTCKSMFAWYKTDRNTGLIRYSGDHVRCWTMTAFTYRHSTWWYWACCNFENLTGQMLILSALFFDYTIFTSFYVPPSFQWFSFLIIVVIRFICCWWRFVWSKYTFCHCFVWHCRIWHCRTLLKYPVLILCNLPY